MKYSVYPMVEGMSSQLEILCCENTLRKQRVTATVHRISYEKHSYIGFTNDF